jgi:hypothetical protein
VQLEEKEMSRDSEQHYHDKGEQDEAEGRYDPPHERIEDLVHDIVAGQSESDRADQEAYETGRDNVK